MVCFKKVDFREEITDIVSGHMELNQSAKFLLLFTFNKFEEDGHSILMVSDANLSLKALFTLTDTSIYIWNGG